MPTRRPSQEALSVASLTRLQATPEIPSPCVRVCVLDNCDVCVGCYRSMDEIMRWTTASNDERQSIVDRADARRRRDPNHLAR